MQFEPPPRPRPSENLLPMINVVFLLLIFFLIAAKLAPPSPFEVLAPQATADAATESPAQDLVLWLGADGTLAYGDARGEAALAALAQARAACVESCARLTLRADAGAGAGALAALAPKLAAMGFARLALVTEAR